MVKLGGEMVVEVTINKTIWMFSEYTSDTGRDGYGKKAVQNVDIHQRHISKQWELCNRAGACLGCLAASRTRTRITWKLTDVWEMSTDLICKSRSIIFWRYPGWCSIQSDRCSFFWAWFDKTIETANFFRTRTDPEFPTLQFRAH
jgi:hypothetical protein